MKTSSDEWLFPAGATAALVDASDGAEDDNNVRAKTLSGKLKTGENTPLLEPLTLGVGGCKQFASSSIATKAIGFSILIEASGLKPAEKKKNIVMKISI